ncbi:hypothetical protein [Flavobacterium sp.]|uniref:hypothetical protein n=1 Tax=Flavobacterium sp. TaxID=239 RepID=UPI003529C617
MSIALGILAVIYIVRAIQLKLFKVKLMPLLFIAPRGLITILLFLSIPEASKIPIVNKALIVQVIVLSALIMMVGLMFNKEENIEKEKNNESDDIDPIEPPLI